LSGSIEKPPPLRATIWRGGGFSVIVDPRYPGITQKISGPSRHKKPGGASWMMTARAPSMPSPRIEESESSIARSAFEVLARQRPAPRRSLDASGDRHLRA
jgi:hypothetical protein